MIVLHPPAKVATTSVHVTADLPGVAGPMIAEAIARTIRKHGRCRLGLSGGSTPASTFAWLRANLPPSTYGQLWVTWIDERNVPLLATAEGGSSQAQPGDWQAFSPDSNLHLAYTHWLAHVPMPPQQVLPMSLGGALPDEVLRFGRAFLDAFGGGLDVTVLGAGPDGHIASIFPDHPAMAVDDVCLGVHDSPKPPAERVTLTLPVLRRSTYTFLLATGAAKADVLLRAWHGDDTLPLGRLQPEGDAHWILDPQAAAAIARETLDTLLNHSP